MSDDLSNLGPMGYFLLAVIEYAGLTSLYMLKEEAGLQPGGIRPAVTELERAGLISRAAPGKRRRRDLKLTDEGREVLRDSWKRCLDDHVDAESIVRSAMVGWFMEGPGFAAIYLEFAGSSRKEKAEAMIRDAEHLKRSQTGPMSSYRWMRLETEAHRRRAEGEVFLSISLSLKESFKTDGNEKASR